jgi:hypothetical protein
VGGKRTEKLDAYAIEQQLLQSDVPKKDMSLMSLIFKNDARSLAKRFTMWLSVKKCRANGHLYLFGIDSVY